MSTKFKILVLDDDESFANSLLQSLETYNYEAVVSISTFDAEDKLKTFCPDLLIVDLFMPSGNGSDWVASLLKQIDFKIPVIYVSGVFTDIEFQNSLMNHSLILKVLSKPFKTAALLQVLEEYQKNQISLNKERVSISSLSCVEKALVGSNYLAKQFIDNLKKPTKLVANNLPEYLTCFFKIKATGVLTIIKDTQAVEVHYNKGNVVFIKMDDTNTSLGALLGKLTQLNYTEIEKHCVTAKEKGQSIGTFLLQQSLIKEIDIFKAINLQIALRFFKLFDDKKVSCEWVEEKEEESAQTKVGFFSIEEWQHILVRFSNNLTEEWVQAFSKKFSSYYLILRKENFPKMINDKVLLDNFSKLEADLSSSYVQFKSLDLTENPQRLKSIYLFLLLDVLALSNSKQLSKKELLVIHNKNKASNYFEVLNVNPDSAEPNIKKAYRQLSKKFHPDNCSFFASSEERDIYEAIFKSISEAYATLSKETLRIPYQSLLEQETFEQQFKKQLLENEIIEQLQGQNLSGLLKKIQDTSIVYAKKQVFLLWALTIAYKEENSVAKKEAIKKKMKIYVKNIPNNILQFNHFVYLAKALYYEIIENLDEAKYYFNKIQSVSSIDIADNLQHIEVLLSQKKKKNIKNKDVQFGAMLAIVIVGILGYNLTIRKKNTFVPQIEKQIVIKPIITKKPKRVLSSIDKKRQIKSYFSGLTDFFVGDIKDEKKYLLISFKNRVLTSKDSNQNKLSIMVYKQLVSVSKTITERNFLKRQNRLKGLPKLTSLKKTASSDLWRGKLNGKNKKTVTVKYIKEHRSFVYLVGDHTHSSCSHSPSEIISIITKALSQL